MIFSNRFLSHSLKIRKLFLFIFILLLTKSVYADDSWMVYDDTTMATIHILINEDALDYMYNNVESDSVHVSSIQFVNHWINQSVDSVGFRLRGNTSRNAAKKSFKLDFNHFVSGRDFFGLEKLNLNGEHNDPSIIRSKLSWDIFEKIGMVATRASHVKLYINGQYYGLYISIEHIDENFLDRHYEDDSGNLWKCIWPADLTYRGDAPEDYHPYVDQDRPYDLKTNKEGYDYSELANFIKIINQSPDSLEQVISMKEVLQYLAINILTGSWDDYRFLKNNYYLYHEPDKDLFHWIPFDYDNSFSVDWFDTDWSDIDPYTYANIDGSERPLTEYIFSNSRYVDLFTHFLDFYMEEVVNIEKLEPRLDYFLDWLTPSAMEDVYRTYDYGFDMDDFTDSYGYEYSDQHVKEGIKKFLVDRVNSLESQLTYQSSAPYIYDIEEYNELVPVGNSVDIDIAVFAPGSINQVSFYSRADGGAWQTSQFYPNPVDETTIVEQHDRWRLSTYPSLPGLVEWYAIAFANGETDRYPVSGFRSFTAVSMDNPSLFVNEIMAINDSTIYDEAGEFDDWLEIYNAEEHLVRLEGFYVSDKEDNLTKWQFPASDTEILPGEHIIVWCDEDEEQGIAHTNFKLSGSGEFLALVAPDGFTIIDSISFPQQQPDLSYGRTTDGGVEWDFFDSPTPGATNQLLSIDQGHSIPNGVSIISAYPNPFNAYSTIRFKTIQKGNIVIRIYNLTGQLLLNKELIAESIGENKWIWNGLSDSGSLVGSGIFFLQLFDDNTSSTIKIVMAK